MEHQLSAYYDITHGLGLANVVERDRVEPYVQDWAMHLEKWLKLKEFINA